MAITKTDLLSEKELEKRKKTLPKNIQNVFISAISQQGIQDLKDIIWESLK